MSNVCNKASETCALTLAFVRGASLRCAIVCAIPQAVSEQRAQLRFRASTPTAAYPAEEAQAVAASPGSDKNRWRTFLREATVGKSGDTVESMASLAASWSRMADEEKARYSEIVNSAGNPRKRKRIEATLPSELTQCPMPSELTPLGIGDQYYPLAHDKIEPLALGARLGFKNKWGLCKACRFCFVRLLSFASALLGRAVDT